jgi:hypothetical protein
MPQACSKKKLASPIRFENDELGVESSSRSQSLTLKNTKTLENFKTSKTFKKAENPKNIAIASSVSGSHPAMHLLV